MGDMYFFSGGVRVSTAVDMPERESSGKIPCAILCHGYTSYRDEFGGFARLSEVLCRNGVGVIRFDFRGCGESTGTLPKGRMLCGSEWVEDVCNAYHYARSLPWADPDKIAVIGMSMGGAAVLSSLKYLAGASKAVAIAPVNCGYDWLKELWVNHSGTTGWDGFLDEVRSHALQRLETGADEWTGVDKILAFTPQDYEVFKSVTAQFPLSTAEATWSSADDIVHRVNASRELLSSTNDIPVMFVHGTGDTLVPCKGTEEMYQEYRFGKELVLLEGKPHALLLEEDMGPLMETVARWVRD